MGGQGDSGDAGSGQEFAEGEIDEDMGKFQDDAVNLSEFKNNFPGKLKFWAVHCSINAIPSYLIAVIFCGQFDNPVAHFAMIAAIITFVISYASITSLQGPLANQDSLLSRALKVGLSLRMICTIWSGVLIPTMFGVLYTPDFWCGYCAVFFVSWLRGIFGHRSVLLNTLNGSTNGGNDIAGFVEIYLTTMVEGFILSLMLCIFSVITVVFLQMRDRKKYMLESMKHNQATPD